MASELERGVDNYSLVIQLFRTINEFVSGCDDNKVFFF